MKNHPFKVYRKSDSALCGEHKTRQGAEKRIARIVAMCKNGKVTADHFEVKEENQS